MDMTPNLALPYIFAAQAQKHVTHNEAIRALDAMVNVSVLDRHLTIPPVAPVEGARYIVPAAATGAWVGPSGRIAAFQDGAWAFYTPREGWIAWIADEDQLVVFDGATWVGAGSGTVNPTPLVGVNATADTTNRLSVASPATLFNHAGAGHQAKINKAAAADTASFLFQTGFSGRAEMGTTGDDDFHFKVSPNGAAWNEAILIDRNTGAVTLPNTTLANNVVTNAKLADMATATFKGRATAATGDPEDLTTTQATALLNPAVGDSGAGGTKGLVPAPVAGDAAAGKYLHANGTWVTPAGGGGGEANTATNVNVGGVGVFKQKTGVNLEFRGVNAASTKVSVALDAVNNEIDLDVVEANLTLPNLGGSIDLGGAKASGTLAAARMAALTGDVTNTVGTLATTIVANAVTNTKLADVPTATLKGRTTAATGDPEDLTAAQARTLLNVADGANNYVHPNHSGDVTSVADGATTIAANAVTNTKLSDVPTATFKGRVTAATGDPEDLTVAQAKTLLNLAGTNNGDQTITLTGDVTGTGTGSFAATIAADAVTNAKLANVATATLKGRTTAATGDPEDLTAAQARTLLNVADGANNYVHPNHSGDVASVADGATTIAADAVTYAKMQNVSAASRLLGRGDSAAGDPQEITLGAGLAMTGTTLSSSGGGGSMTTQDEGVTLNAAVTTLNFVGAGVTASGAGATTTITIPGGGGGGTPGGSDTQVQFNNAGAFAGAAGLTYNSATQISKHAVAADLESQAASPAAPATGSRLFSRPHGGRQIPSFRNGGNVESPFQPWLARNKTRLWAAQGNSATVSLIGLANTVTGTTTNRTNATTNLFAAMARLGFVSATTAGSTAGTRHGFTQFFMGNGTAGAGGFHYVTRFGVSDAATVANARMFVGLAATASVFANVDPSTLLNQIGLGCDAGQTTLRIMHNDGAGVSTLIDLGANFPTQTLSVDMYELQLYCAPNGSTVGYRVERLNTGDVATGTISTDLPTNTTLLSPQLWRNNGVTALAVGIDVVHQYLETDY